MLEASEIEGIDEATFERLAIEAGLHLARDKEAAEIGRQFRIFIDDPLFVKSEDERVVVAFRRPRGVAVVISLEAPVRSYACAGSASQLVTILLASGV